MLLTAAPALRRFLPVLFASLTVSVSGCGKTTSTLSEEDGGAPDGDPRDGEGPRSCFSALPYATEGSSGEPCVASPGKAPAPGCSDAIPGGCAASSTCNIDESKCGSASTCLPLA